MVFGSSSLCGKTFTKKKYVKSHFRGILTVGFDDKHEVWAPVEGCIITLRRFPSFSWINRYYDNLYPITIFPICQSLLGCAFSFFLSIISLILPLVVKPKYSHSRPLQKMLIPVVDLDTNSIGPAVWVYLVFKGVSDTAVRAYLLNRTLV